MYKRILIVEDDADVRRLIRLTLEPEAYELREADSCSAALEAVRREPPDLVLLDERIRGVMNGLQLCCLWRHDPALQAMRIVVLAAPSACDDPQAARRVGAHDCLVKPFSAMALAAMVRVQCGMPSTVLAP